MSTYEEALQELQVIVQQLQQNEVGVDDLAAKVKRAAALIKYCREKLRTTEDELQNLFGA